MSIGEKSLQYFENPTNETIENGKAVIKYKYKLCPMDNFVVGTNIGNLGSHLRHVHAQTFALITNQKDTLPVKRLRLLQNAVEIVSVNGRPFNYLLDSGYQKGISNKLKKLRDEGLGIDFSNRNLPEVKHHLSEMAKKVREQIKEEVKDRVLSLMVDIGTKNKRSILGVTVQYNIEGKLKVRSLGLVELKNHTQANIWQM